jgi:hypothetical protein
MFSFLFILFSSTTYIHILFITLGLLLLCLIPLIYHSPIVFIHIYIGQYTDDTKTIRRIQQQTGLEGDDENITKGMFQANYQYTPLKEYAAMKNTRTTNDTNPNSYQSKLNN